MIHNRKAVLVFMGLLCAWTMIIFGLAFTPNLVKCSGGPSTLEDTIKLSGAINLVSNLLTAVFTPILIPVPVWKDQE